MGDLYFWRQIFVLMTALLASINFGTMTSFPSTLIADLTNSNDTDINVTKDQISWIVTSNGIAGFAGYFIFPPVMQMYGRKVVQFTTNLLTLIGWIIFVLAYSFEALLAARIIQGLSMGGFFMNFIIISEYCDPKRRGFFISTKRIAIAVGTLMSHSLTLVCNWRTIAVTAIVCPVLSMTFVLFWPESPSYLALKGRFEECEKSFIWLHGSSNRQEMYQLQSSQQQKTKNESGKSSYKFLFKKDFLKPVFILSLLAIVLESCGNMYVPVYAIKMMMELIGDKSQSIYFSIGADLFTIFAIMWSFTIINHFKRRIILFGFGALIVVLMFTICGIVKFFNLSAMMWLTPVLFVLHSFLVNFSVAPVSSVIIGEVNPLQYRGSVSCLTGLTVISMYTFTLKLTPIIIENSGIGGVNGIYGTILGVCLVVLYYILPETKDKTLQGIENELKGVDVTNCEDLLPKPKSIGNLSHIK